MKIDAIIRKAIRIGFVEVETDYEWTLFEKEIELNTIMENVLIFGTYTIKGYVRIENNRIHVSGNYGRDGSTTFIDNDAESVTAKNWFDAMVSLHTNDKDD